MRFFMAAGFALVLAALTPLHQVSAQTIIGPVYLLPLYTYIGTMPWRDSLYLYPRFQEGAVVLANGNTTAKLMINYNVYRERMEVIIGKDTTALKNVSNVSLLQIGSHIIYQDPSKGYIELLGEGPIFLGVLSEFKVVMGSSAGERFRATDLRESNSRFDRFYTKYQLYYFLDDTKLYPAIPSKISELFPASQDEIKKFIEDRQINFKRKRDLLTLLSYCNSIKPNGTPATQSIFKLKAGLSPFQTDWRDSIYRFAEFQEGRIAYSTGATPKNVARLNYNELTGAMDHMTEKNDTATEVNPRDIRSASIDDHQFYRDPEVGFVEILLQGPLSLAVSNRLIFFKREILADSSEATVDKSQSPEGSHPYLFYKKKTTYFFIDSHNHTVEATRESIGRLYRRHEKKIGNFVREQKIDFGRESDLKKLISLINSLEGTK
jgi:hypothetical protein